MTEQELAIGRAVLFALILSFVGSCLISWKLAGIVAMAWAGAFLVLAGLGTAAVNMKKKREAASRKEPPAGVN